MTDITAKLAEALRDLRSASISRPSCQLHAIARCRCFSCAHKRSTEALEDYRQHTEAQAGGTEGEREAFEDWAKHCRQAFHIGRFTASDENWAGQYTNVQVQTGWEAWQARAALAAAPAAAQRPGIERRKELEATEEGRQLLSDARSTVVAALEHDAFERGRQQGMSQANALWEMAKAEQAVPVAVVKQTGWELCDNAVFVFGVPVQNFGSRLLDAVAFANRINAAARAAPPATERRPLTDEQALRLAANAGNDCPVGHALAIVRATERHHNIGTAGTTEQAKEQDRG